MGNNDINKIDGIDGYATNNDVFVFSVINSGVLPELSAPTGENLAEWNKWVEERPPVVADLARRVPPWQYYDMPETGQVVTVESYFEDGTLRVRVVGDRVSIPAIVQFGVFGIRPKDLKVRP